MVDPGLCQTNSVLVSIENGIIELHKGVSQDEKVLLPTLFNVKARDTCHTNLIPWGVHVCISPHKVVRVHMIVLSVYYESQGTKMSIVYAILFVG